MFTVYIIRSESTGRYYYGHTADLDDRFVRHNADRSAATKGRGPWKLLASKPFPTKGEAMRFEQALKRMKNPERALAAMQVNG